MTDAPPPADAATGDAATGDGAPRRSRAPLEAVLLDAMGTLIELAEPPGDTYARIAAEHGVALPAWRLGDAFERVRRRMPPMVFPDADARDVPALERAWWRDLVRQVFLATDGTAHFADFEAFFDALFAHYARAAAWRLRPGARDALSAMRARGWRLGVVSNFDHRLAGILEDLGIASFFDVVATPATARAAKPDPAALAAAIAGVRAPAAACAYVGDDAALDARAARAAGMRFVDVSALDALDALPALVEAA